MSAAMGAHYPETKHRYLEEQHGMLVESSHERQLHPKNPFTQWK